MLNRVGDRKMRTDRKMATISTFRFLHTDIAYCACSRSTIRLVHILLTTRVVNLLNLFNFSMSFNPQTITKIT
jgi:hypothetical protein